MTINQATMQQLEDARHRLAALVDGHTQANTRAWSQAWADLEDDWLLAATLAAAARPDGKRLTAAQLRKQERLVDVQARTDEAVATLAVEQRPTQASVQEVVRLAGEAERALIGSQMPRGSLPSGLPVSSASVAASEALVQRFGERMIVGWSGIPAAARAGIASTLLKGFRAGGGPEDVARRVVDSVQGAFTLSMSRANVVTRTEFLDAHRAGALATDEANAEVLRGWQHLANLDVRTCAACLAQHGSVHPVSEPGPLDHQQGRCARVPLTKSWAELGFTGMDEPEDVLPDARAWFDGLTQSERERVMGVKRLALLDSGAVSWGDLAKRRETSGWRASYVPTPVRDLQAMAKGAR